MLWHKRLGHINFKNINKLVKDNLVRGLPSTRFENDQNCVVCLKGKQHKVSFKSKTQNSISQPLFMLHMDLFGPTSVSSIMHKKYYLVITDDFSGFTWVFFLATKDKTSRILKSFITEIENLVEKKVKIIRCVNGTEFKNRVMNEFCEEKGIKREFNVARTPQQNRVLVVKPYFKTPYELFKGRSPALSFMRPFGCHVTILNTLDHLGKFDGKSDEGIFVGYSTISKAFRVYNTRTRKVEENLHITFLENKPMIAGGGPEWLFDIDAVSKSMNYAPVPTGIHFNNFASKGESFDAGQSSMETGPSQDYILMPLWKDSSLFDSSSQDSDGHNKDKHDPSQASESDNQERHNAESSTKTVNTARPVNTATPTYADYLSDPLIPDLEDTEIFDDAYDDRDEGAEADYNNLETVISVSPIPSTRIHKDHLEEQIIGEVNFAVQTRKMTKQNEAGLITFINKQRRKNHKDFQNCLFACFLSQRNQRRLFLAYASFMDFTMYQMDVKSAFLYGTIEEEVYVSQPPGFVDPKFPDRVYKILDELHGELTFFLGLQIEQQKDGIFLSQDKYVCDILNKFCFSSVTSASTPMETHKALSKDAAGTVVDVHLYRKSTTRGCQFLGSLALNQLLNYGYNFMQTNIHVDNESAICVVKNLVYHSKIKHIEIRNHFIRDSYEKRLIEMVKIHTDYNVVDLLTKAFDVTREFKKNVGILLKRIQKFFLTYDNRAHGAVYIFSTTGFTIATGVEAQTWDMAIWCEIPSLCTCVTTNTITVAPSFKKKTMEFQIQK
nr:hypothetical protein [Tanacetum cinerariifolium]